MLERDGIQMAVAENGGDPEQDGCAFRTDNVVALRDEFIANGLDKIGAVDDDLQGDRSLTCFLLSLRMGFVIGLVKTKKADKPGSEKSLR